ncbi:hypothetical protein Tco_0564944 [Tanacetum coccineum]
MTKPTSEDNLHGSDNTTHSANLNDKFKIGDEFLKILQNNTFNGIDRGNVINRMAKVHEISDWIKIPNLDHNQIRLHVFSNSLSGDAKEWWNNEIDGTVTTWNELGEKFFLKYYPLSHTCNSKILDDLDNGTDYLEFLNWLGSKFKNHWNLDRNTKNGLWDFYVRECNDKGSISDVEPSDKKHDEPCNKTTKNPALTYFLNPIWIQQKPQEGNGIYNFEESNEYSPQIPVPTEYDVSNPDELCKSEKFRVIRYSIGSDEEFITISLSNCNTWGKTHGAMSSIYHDLFNKNYRGWLVKFTK